MKILLILLFIGLAGFADLEFERSQDFAAKLAKSEEDLATARTALAVAESRIAAMTAAQGNVARNSPPAQPPAQTGAAGAAGQAQPAQDNSWMWTKKDGSLGTAPALSGGAAHPHKK